MDTPHPLPCVRRREAFALGAALLGALTPAAFAQSSVANPVARPAGTHAEIKWDDLVPKGWDPMQGLDLDPNIGTLNDADPKVQDLMRRLRQVWDNAPVVTALEGASIKLPGYVVPLEESRSGLAEFLLVPYFGACIHTPPPPANQIVLVVPAKPLQGFRSMDTVWVRGTLRTARTGSPMGTSAYRLDAAVVDRYTRPEK